MADDDIIRGGLDIVTDQKNNKPKAEQETAQPTAARLQTYRGFIKGRALDKLTGCERDLAINLPGCFHLLFLLSFTRKTKNAWLKNPTDLPAQKRNKTPGPNK